MLEQGVCLLFVVCFCLLYVFVLFVVLGKIAFALACLNFWRVSVVFMMRLVFLFMEG